MMTTPRRIDLPEAAAERFQRISQTCARLSTHELVIRPAYSVKTNPKVTLLRLARAHGFRAEVIGADELSWAQRCGFAAGEIIYNGPEPVPDRAVAMCFADSVEAFARNLAYDHILIHGIRLRPSSVASRFGVPAAEDAQIARWARMHPGMPIGVSMHVRREDYRGRTWLQLSLELVERAARLQAACDCPVTVVDVGGGWEPRQFDDRFEPDASALLPVLRRTLEHVRQLVIEPGQAVATPSEAVLTAVLEVRRRPDRREAIVDLGYNDWPQLHAFTHRISVERQGEWQLLPPGVDRLGGRTCLEYDILEGIGLPADLRVDEVLRVDDVGAYDASMAFRFGRGA